MTAARAGFAFVAAVVAAGGCAVVPERDSGEPGVRVPPQWTAAAEEESAAGVEPWLDDFDDPGLAALAREAVGASFELEAAAARVDAALARAVIAGADRLPVIAASVDASRVRRGITSESIRAASLRTNRYAAGIDISWEADLWGRLGNRARAGALDVEVSAGQFEAARLTLAANIARAWFDAAQSSLQLQLAQSTVASFESTLEVIEDRFRRGLNSALDVRLARANVSGAVSRREAGKVSLDGQRRRLEVLAGRYPGGEVETRNTLPSIARAVPAGLPAELLTRRPDVVAAQRRLGAADERATAASKNRLPRIVLTGVGGTASGELENLLYTESLVWSLAGGLVAPVFEGGRLKAQADAADAESREALAAYGQTLLEAFREVETALGAERYLAAQEAALSAAAEESVLAETLALEQYRAGLVEIVTLLESQRRSFDAQQALIEVKNRRLQNRIDLYLALGGDFDSPATPGDDAGVLPRTAAP